MLFQTTTFTANELLQIVLQRQDPWYWLLAIGFEYIMPVLPYALIFHSFNYNYYETFACIVCCEDIWREGDLNTTEESPGKAYWQYLIRWQLLMTQNVIHFRLSFKLNIKKIVHNSQTPPSLDIFVTSCLGNTALENIFLITSQESRI